MSDVAEVKEAIEQVAKVLQQSVQGCDEFHAGGLVLDAARRWVRMVETGERMDYCEAHQSLSVTPGYRCDHYRHLRTTGNEGSPCRIVSRLVAAVGVEKETTDE